MVSVCTAFVIVGTCFRQGQDCVVLTTELSLVVLQSKASNKNVNFTKYLPVVLSVECVWRDNISGGL